MSLFSRYLVAIIPLAFTLSSVAQAASNSGTSLLALRAHGSYFTNAGGETITGGVSWNPGFSLSDSLSLRGDIGATFPKSSLDSVFVAIHYGALVGWQFAQNWEVEAGGGMETWLERTTAPYAAGNLHRLFSGKLLGLFDRAFLGGSYQFRDTATTEIRAGLGISF